VVPGRVLRAHVTAKVWLGAGWAKLTEAKYAETGGVMGWNLPPGCTDADIDREAERLSGAPYGQSEDEEMTELDLVYRDLHEKTEELESAKARIARMEAALELAVRKISTEIMRQRSGPPPYKTLSEWEEFLRAALNAE
jgi:hypothetical protein